MDVTYTKSLSTYTNTFRLHYKDRPVDV